MFHWFSGENTTGKEVQTKVYVYWHVYWLYVSFAFQNEAIPDTDEGPTMEVAQPLTREGTPTGEHPSMERDTIQEEPDASATPPPPESHSPEPTMELEPLDTYIESGNLTNWIVFNY